MLELAALIVGTLTTSLIALTVLTKNSHSITNRLFVGMSFSLVFWSLCTYFSLHTASDEQTLMWMRPIMFFVVLQNTFFFFLVRVFPSNHYNLFQSLLYKLAGIYSVVVALIALSPLLFVDFEDGAPVPGPGMALFLPHAAIFAVGGIGYLFHRFIKSKGVLRTQLGYFLAGTVLLYTLVPVGNFVLPVALKTDLFVILSPLYSIVFSGLFAYGIISRKLFDIRAAVARGVAYLLSLGLISLIYGVFIYLVSIVFTGNIESNNLQRAIFVGFALISAVFFHPTKQYFDRLSNRIFFRDAYDPQEFLDDLNKSLVADIEIGILLRHTAKVIEDNLSSSFCVFGVHETEMEPVRIIGTQDNKITKERFFSIHEQIKDSAKKEIVTDELDGDSKLKRLLTKSDVAIVSSLQVSSKDDSTNIAYLILGSKKSGNIYNKQDLRILDIITDELVIAIQNALRFEEIQGFAITLQAKVNEATLKLKKTNEKLKDLDETKDEFISMASHQLRTPLTSVKGYLSMVLEGDAGKLTVMQQELLNQAFVSSQRMVYLIADLLNVSRLKTGKFIIDAHPTDLSELVEGEIIQLKEVAKSKKVTLDFKKPESFPILLLDETKIRQVVMNFADNAIYYTPSGGNINIEVKDDKSNVYFIVKDNGLGVPKEDQSHLFTKFYRAKNARQARPDGTGLGLFMAKKVINAQGGDILFESKEGKGSTFGFTFRKDKLEEPTKVKAEEIK